MNILLFFISSSFDNITEVNNMKKARIYLQYIFRINNFWKPHGNNFSIYSPNITMNIRNIPFNPF